MSRLRSIRNTKEKMAMERLDRGDRRKLILGKEDFDPTTALGVSASRNIETGSTFLPILIIFGSTFIFGVTSSVMLSSTPFHDPTDRNITIVITSISWFVFLNFFFLLIKRTRLLNILLFLSIAALSLRVWDNNRQSPGNGTLSIVMLIVAILSFIPFLILLLYYFQDNSIEILEIRTNEELRKYRAEREREINERIEKAIQATRTQMYAEDNPMGKACNEIFENIRKQAILRSRQN